ncbi:MAG: gamma-glutamyltransferase, partial [bacterium]
MRRFALVVSLLVAEFCTAAPDTIDPIIQFSGRFHPTISRGGMVVSQERIASETGAAILDQGGNAIDAAVATGFALAVTFPQAGNIGGGGFMLVYSADEQKTYAIDYREMAPALAHRDLFLDKDQNVDRELSRFSHKSAGVPGAVAGLLHVQRKFGRLPLETVMAPAIKLAAEGFVVDYPLAASLDRARERMSRHPAAQAYFYPHSQPDGRRTLLAGDRLVQKDLAKTLGRIAKHGAEGFYRGTTARLIVEEMQRGGGLVSMDDLENYSVVEREPITGSYRGYEIASMPPPSSGGIHLVQMLNILEGYDLRSLEHNSAQYIHYLVEAARRAYADRSEYLGDPDFVTVPVKQLTDKNYADRLRRGIADNQASTSDDVRPGQSLPPESPETTHFSTWDAEGNVVSNTYTLNFSYGSGIAVTGAGFLLNNEMDDFSAKPGVPNAYGLLGGEANGIEPAKRPLSSMTPTLIFKDGRPVAATGSPGGSTIITVVMQQILNMIEFDMNVAEAAASPRIHHQWYPDEIVWEQGISIDTRDKLSGFGHEIRAAPVNLGRTQSIENRGGVLQGYSDNRWPGGSAVAAEKSSSEKNV